jgi:hypothetical protein
MTALDTSLDRCGRWLARWLDRPAAGISPYTHGDLAAVEAVLLPADVVLVEGSSRIAGAIKYLTQSTWSHAALYAGTDLDGSGLPMVVEVNLGEGCVLAPLDKYRCFNLRICRAKGLGPSDRVAVVDYMAARVGTRYDLRNIVDLLRYFLPEPPVPARFRRRMIAFGAGDPTRAICSSMIARAFQSIHYPILPSVTRAARDDPMATAQRAEILHIRHHSLFTPRDFDLSPYFEIIKPTLAGDFDHRRLTWSDRPEAGAVRAEPAETLLSAG